LVEGVPSRLQPKKLNRQNSRKKHSGPNSRAAGFEKKKAAGVLSRVTRPNRPNGTLTTEHKPPGGKLAKIPSVDKAVV